MTLSFEKVVLNNGLQVIAHEDRRVPMVAVSVWYHTGSNRERPGKTGLAHLFEHLMFEGSEHLTGGFFEMLQNAGGSLNGSTNSDRTNYWEVVPSGAESLALWMESDRMGWLIPALTDARFQTQRDVVMNERRQNYENRPYGRAPFAIMAALYAPAHPYHWPTIGWPGDLRAATVDDARAFFTRYYHPGNASLAIAGDITPDRAFALAEKYFGEIPAGEAVGRVVVPPTPHAEPVRLVLEDRVELPRLYMVWPTPALFAQDDAELDLAADLLANGRSSRLYREMVFERRVATEIAASQGSRELGSQFQIVATAAPGHTLDELREAIEAGIARVAGADPSTAELDRGRLRAEMAFVSCLDTLGGFGGKADQLNAYNTYCGTPGFFEADLARYLSATPRGLSEAVARWLTAAAPVSLSVVPHGHAEMALAGSTRSEVL